MSDEVLKKNAVSLSGTENNNNSNNGNGKPGRKPVEDESSSDSDSESASSPPPIPPTKPPVKNPKEKTIQALNLIYAKKPTPSTISTTGSSFAPGDGPPRPVTISSVTTRNDVEIVKNTTIESSRKSLPAPPAKPQHSPSHPPGSPTAAATSVRLPGLWFNMVDQYPVENFSGREAILEEIEGVVKGVKSRDARPISRSIILLGEPSMGKTEIARKYAFKFYVSYDGYANVVWIDASTQESIKEDLVKLDDYELRMRLNAAARPQSPNTLNPNLSQGLSPFPSPSPSPAPPVSPENVDLRATVGSTIQLSEDANRPLTPTSPTPSEIERIEFNPKIVGKSKLSKSPNSRKSSVKGRSGKQQQHGQFDELDHDARIESVLRNPIFQELPTLFIFDNAQKEADIINYLPKLSPVGHIPNFLVTSNNENERFWSNSRIIHVPPFDIADAVHFLLESFLDIPEFTRNQAHGLAKEFHYFPPLLQRARRMVLNNLEEFSDSERPLLRLEKNVGLVRRLNGSAINRKEVEIAVLSVDRGNYFENDPYIREYEDELRTHPLSLRLHQIETTLPSILRKTGLSILVVNDEAYIMAIISQIAGPTSKILGVYGGDHYDEETVAEQTRALNRDNPDLIKTGRIELRLVETPKAKGAKKSRTSQVLEKLRSIDGKVQYDIILTSLFVDTDLTPVKKLLVKGGRFITSMTSTDVGVALKKVDPKRLEIKMTKKDFPELLVNVQKL